MTDPILVPRSSSAPMFITWGVATVLAIVIGIVIPAPARFGWLSVAAAVVLFLAFGLSLWTGRAEGFIQRTAAAAVGGIVAMGVVSLVIMLADIATV